MPHLYSNPSQDCVNKQNLSPLDIFIMFSSSIQFYFEIILHYEFSLCQIKFLEWAAVVLKQKY